MSAAVITLLRAAALLALCGGLLHAQYLLPRSVMGAGGCAMAGTGAGIVGTAGQPLIGLQSAASDRLSAGFWYGLAGVATDTRQPQQPPGRMRLSSGCPNPSAGAVRFEYAPERSGTVDIAVYSTAGIRLRTLFSGEAWPGPRTVTWDGRTDGGAAAPSGVYLVRLHAGTGTSCRSIVLLR